MPMVLYLMRRRLNNRMNYGVKILFTLFVFFAYFLQAASSFGDHTPDDYPLRYLYPALTPISTDELAAIFSEAVIIDSRSRLEYEVIHIKGAFNLLVGEMTEADLLDLRDKNGGKPLVFYCNGYKCPKSYKAAEKAGGLGFKNVRVYDGGIFRWANSHPEKTILFGSQLTRGALEKKLIPDEDFHKVNISTEELLSRHRSGKYVTIDIRDMNERKENPVLLEGVRQINLNVIKTLLEQDEGPIPKRHILVFDNVGQQTRWLQYYFIKYGRSDYYFLEGGIRQWQKDGYSPEGEKTALKQR
ncbi:MAG: rhodanese-like domain-containing protein [Nitrospiraceae bacterium]|nr:MAG: rhodanese-like domain-containing protein [Nitrospiraceae bacterium]